MPLHAQIVCIGGNLAVAGILFLATLASLDTPPLALFIGAMAVSTLYSAWVHIKFKRHLARERRATSLL